MKLHLLIRDKNNSKAPWATAPKNGLWVAKARGCVQLDLIFFKWSIPELKEFRSDIVWPPTQYLCPASSNPCNSGMLHENKQ